MIWLKDRLQIHNRFELITQLQDREFVMNIIHATPAKQSSLQSSSTCQEFYSIQQNNKQRKYKKNEKSHTHEKKSHMRKWAVLKNTGFLKEERREALIAHQVIPHVEQSLQMPKDSSQCANSSTPISCILDEPRTLVLNP